MKFSAELELFVLELGDAVSAYILAVDDTDVFCISAEDACRLVLLEHDIIAVYKDLDRVVDVDVEVSSELDRKYDSAEFIDFSYYTSCFHS